MPCYNNVNGVSKLLPLEFFAIVATIKLYPHRQPGSQRSLMGSAGDVVHEEEDDTKLITPRRPPESTEYQN